MQARRARRARLIRGSLSAVVRCGSPCQETLTKPAHDLNRQSSLPGACHRVSTPLGAFDERHRQPLTRPRGMSERTRVRRNAYPISVHGRLWPAPRPTPAAGTLGGRDVPDIARLALAVTASGSWGSTR